jgi:hypothetical protein
MASKSITEALLRIVPDKEGLELTKMVTGALNEMAKDGVIPKKDADAAIPKMQSALDSKLREQFSNVGLKTAQVNKIMADKAISEAELITTIGVGTKLLEGKVKPTQAIIDAVSPIAQKFAGQIPSEYGLDAATLTRRLALFETLGLGFNRNEQGKAYNDTIKRLDDFANKLPGRESSTALGAMVGDMIGDINKTMKSLQEFSEGPVGGTKAAPAPKPF